MQKPEQSKGEIVLTTLLRGDFRRIASFYRSFKILYGKQIALVEQMERRHLDGKKP
jgi:hypothetical protein